MTTTLRDIRVAALKAEAVAWSKAIRESEGDVARLAKNLGCSRSHCYQRIQRLHLEEFLNAIRSRHGLPLLSAVPASK